MRILLSVLALVFLTASCKKGKDTITTPHNGPLTDFALIPVKDATWKVVTRGTYPDPNNLVAYDSNYYYTTTVNCTGKDTIIYGNKYYIFQGQELETYIKDPSRTFTPVNYFLYIREDTVINTVYAWNFSKRSDDQVVNLNGDDAGTPTPPWPRWPQMKIKYVDSLLLNGQYLKHWETCNSFDNNLNYFYKAYGIGSQSGIVPRSGTYNIGGLGSQVISLDFTYKTDKFHFDFDFH